MLRQRTEAVTDITSPRQDAFPMKVWAKRIDSVAALAEKHAAIWSEHAPMKQLYAWVPDELELSGEIGMTKTEAQRLADEAVDRLNLTGILAIHSSELVLKASPWLQRCTTEKDMINAGYAFHYTRNLHAVPITYTAVSGGAKWVWKRCSALGYETLDIYITKDGIDEICFANQYDIGSPDTNKMELLHSLTLWRCLTK